MKTTLVLGAGGHAVVVIAALIESGASIAGILDPDKALHGQSILGIGVLGDDQLIEQWGASDILLVNGIGGTDNTRQRRMIFEKFRAQGYSFSTVVHPAAVISRECNIAEGAQVMAGAVIQPRSRIGENTIINTRTGIDHDCDIAAHVHIAPGATLSGGVSVGAEAMIGAGATVIQSMIIGHGALVAAGATVTENVAPEARVAGTPARDL